MTNADFINNLHIESNNQNVAFVLGNGYHNYIYSKLDYSLDNECRLPSWNQLINILGKEIRIDDIEIYTHGVSNIELLSIIMQLSDENIHNKIHSVIKSKELTNHHTKFANNLKQWNIPILTTNYDVFIEQALNTTDYCFKQYNSKCKHCLNEYSALNELSASKDGFSIWHINGKIGKPSSIKAGLGDYCKFISYIDTLIPKLKRGRDLEESDIFKNSWLNIFFKKKLCFIGLGLDEAEILLRWLLFKRKILWKYFHPNQNDDFLGWFVEKEGMTKEGKRLLLNSSKLALIEFNTWDDIYKEIFDL